MKKHLFISLLMLFMMLVLVGCGKLAAPNDVKTENNKLTFSEVAGATSYVGEITKSDGSKVTVEVKNGEDLVELNLGLGSFNVRIKAKSGDNESEYSEAIQYEVTKLARPKNVEIKADAIYFDDVKDASTYQVIFVNGSDEIKKTIKSGQLLTNFGLNEGTYDVYVIADDFSKTNATSERSEKVTYTVALISLDVPTGLAIEDGYLFFDFLSATNDYVVKFTSGDNVILRDVHTGGCTINELLIPEGTYKVSIKAKGDGLAYKDSPFSSEIDFVKEESFMELKENDLVKGGYIKWMGRTYYNESTKANEVYHSASGFELFFKGSTVVATITATNYNNADLRPCIVIVVDDDFTNATTLFLDQASQDVMLVSGNKDALEHKVDLYKRSESIDSHIAVSSIKTDGVFLQKIVEKDLKIEVIAASSSTGYGNLGNPNSGKKTTTNSDCLQGFAFLTAQALDADINIFSASGWGCAFSEWTSPKTLNVADAYKYVDFKSTIPWFSAYYIPDVIVVNLGTNDGSYIKAGSTDAEKEARLNAFQKKYVDFLVYLNDQYPDAQLIILYGLMGETSMYDSTVAIYRTAKLLIPDLEIIQINGDAKGYNYHPSVASHKKIAEELTAFIQKLLED